MQTYIAVHVHLLLPLEGGCSELPPTGPTRWASDPSPMLCGPTEYHAVLKRRLMHDCGGGQES